MPCDLDNVMLFTQGMVALLVSFFTILSSLGFYWPENVNYSVISKSVLYLPLQSIIANVQLKYLSFIGLNEAFTGYVQNITYLHDAYVFD